jgi:hypothetical protein
MAANMTMTGTPYLVKSGTSKVSCVAGAAIVAGDICYIDANGLAQLAVSTQCVIANVSQFQGISITAHAAGDPVTLFGIGAQVYLTDTAQTGNTLWYVSATAGKVYDAKVATADTTFPVLKMITTHVGEIVHPGT